ncbi:hypothetical protein [Microbacterium aurum]
MVGLIARYGASQRRTPVPIVCDVPHDTHHSRRRPHHAPVPGARHLTPDA